MPDRSETIKVLLSTLNAKYIHSSLALRYLQSFCRGQDGIKISIKEFTINQPVPTIMGEIYLHQPDVLGFSCYIWNIGQIMSLCEDYKKVAPHAVIILGGPEVSYNAAQVLREHSFIDCIVSGEGEDTFLDLLLKIKAQQPWDSVPGISYRQEHLIRCNPERVRITDLDRIPFPYQQEMNLLADRVVYYESSRGCPFRCTYCLSSISPGVRHLSLERVKVDLAYLLPQPLREIKFVDRTFNCDEMRARAIIEFIVAHRGSAKVHFEIDAGLFSEAMLDFLETVPPELFNFEIGIQSTYAPALEAVGRHQDWARLRHNIGRLQKCANIHLHLDLIAGLPGEDLDNFGRSFNMVYDLQPDVLQLGFLKVLKGSALERSSQQYGYVYQSQAPYQVLASQELTYQQILLLTRVEDMLDKYFNSGDMPRTAAYIVQEIYPGQAMNFYRDLADYWQAERLFGVGHTKEARYNYLLGFLESQHPEHLETAYELLKYDYLCRNHKYGLPSDWFSYNPANINDLMYGYARDREFVGRHLAQLATNTAREIKKHIHIEYLRVDPHTFRKSDSELRFMFVYNPRSRICDRIIDLDAPNNERSHRCSFTYGEIMS